MTENQDKERNKEGKKRKIFEALKNFPEGTSPKNISSVAGLKPSTVRSYISELEEEGSVEKVCYGIYKVSKHTYRDEKPKMQNFILSYKIPEGIEVEERIEETYDMDVVKLDLRIGKRSRKVTGQFAAEPPVSLKTGLLCFYLFAEKVGKFLDFSVSVDDVTCTTIEINQDFSKFRLDGANCITFSDFRGILEKVYNREDALRREVKISIPFGKEALKGIFAHGLQYNSIFSHLSSISDTVGELRRETVKNRKMLLKIFEKNGWDMDEAK